MSEFTITRPIRMDALYPEARVGDLFVATHPRHNEVRVILVADSCGQATFVDEYGDRGSRQFGPEWTLQHVGPSWVTRDVAYVTPTMNSQSNVAERVLQSTAPVGYQPSFSAAFHAGVRYAIQRLGGKHL